MKAAIIGDLHGALAKIKKIPLKDVDLIQLTGDLGKADLARSMAFENIERRREGLPEIEHSAKLKKEAYMESYTSSVDAVNYLRKFAPVQLVFGNVESSNAETRKQAREIGAKLPFLYDKLQGMKGVRVLNNSLANVGGVRVGGLEYFSDVSWVREFKPKPYSERLRRAGVETRKARRVLKWFGKNLDILLCHQPPYGILDKVNFKGAPKGWNGKHAGSKAILDYIKRFGPRYVVCGHIHEAEGKKKVGDTEVINVGAVGSHYILDIK